MNNKKQLFKKCIECGLQSEDMSLYRRTFNKLKNGTINIAYKNLCNKCGYNRYKNGKIKETQSEKLKLIREIKNSPCIDCGIKYPYYVMDFDHIKDKNFNIARGITKTISSIIEEIEKCELVCANCHRIRTHSRRINNSKSKKGLD